VTKMRPIGATFAEICISSTDGRSHPVKVEFDMEVESWMSEMFIPVT
jgi:hypothetical protein